MNEEVSDPLLSAQALADVVAEHAALSETQRYLVGTVAQAFAQAGLYRIAAPQDCYGSELSPAAQMAVIEAIARVDGSAAWNLMIGIETFGLLAPAFGQLTGRLADPAVIMASSTAAVGKAQRVEGGYRISGQWPFVSGIHNAHLFGATVQVWEDGEPRRDLGNRYAIIDRADLQILDTWHTSGLCGSGSHDVVVDDVMVSDAHLILPLGGVEHPSPLIRFPLGARLAYNKVAVACGLARAGIDAFVELATVKKPRFTRMTLRERPAAARAVAAAEARLGAGRAWVHELLAPMWQAVQAGKTVSTKERALFQLACSDAVQGCIEAVDGMAQAAGTSANMKNLPLERIVRDVRVVGQHTTVAAHHIDDAGRLLLGLPAQEMMLAGLDARNEPVSPDR